jgi:hypothetical protein
MAMAPLPFDGDGAVLRWSFRTEQALKVFINNVQVRLFTKYESHLTIPSQFHWSKTSKNSKVQLYSILAYNLIKSSLLEFLCKLVDWFLGMTDVTWNRRRKCGSGGYPSTNPLLWSRLIGMCVGSRWGRLFCPVGLGGFPEAYPYRLRFILHRDQTECLGAGRFEGKNPSP